MLDQEVGTLPLENFVGLLLNNYDYVACLYTWVLVSFAVEHVLLAVRCALVNISLNNLLLLDDFLTIAVFALVFFVNYFSLAIAIIAGA